METGPSRTTGWRSLARYAVAVPLVFALFATSLSPMAPGVAAAQERPRTVIEMLFGRGSVEAPQRQIRPQKIYRKAKPKRDRPVAKRQKSRSASKPAARKRPASRAAPKKQVAAAPAPEPVIEKSDQAETVLVVGDFVADAVAEGLQAAVSDNPDVAVVSKADGSSGLVRDDHYNWLEKLGPMIDETKPAVVVVALGSNDRQPLDAGSGTLALRSEGWTAEYQRRIDAMARIAKDKGVPLVWIGMPAFKFDRMSEDMVFFNDLYRKAAANVSGEFVDVWDGFVDANGIFSYTGPDVSGQPAQLRNSDGITMTEAGQEKLAFFAKKPIFKFLGQSVASLAPGIDAVPGEDALPPGDPLTRGPVSLNDPAFDGGDGLLGGGSTAPRASEPSARDLLVLSGAPTGDVSGRADNFQWNVKSKAVSPATQEAPIAFRGSVDLQPLQTQGVKPPEEMPSLADAIVEEWTKEVEAAKTLPGNSAPPAPPGQ